MTRRIIVSGVLGAIAMMLWAFVANTQLGLQPRVNMNRVSDEARVHQVLKENITKPGGYVVSAPVTAEGVFPAGEPVFAVRYSGLGHEDAGRTMLWEFALWTAACMIAAWLLSVRGETGYQRRLLFCVAVGLLFAVFTELPKWSIGGYPFGSVLLLAGNTLAAWTLAGLVIAWQVRPTVKTAT